MSIGSVNSIQNYGKINTQRQRKPAFGAINEQEARRLLDHLTSSRNVQISSTSPIPYGIFSRLIPNNKATVSLKLTGGTKPLLQNGNPLHVEFPLGENETFLPAAKLAEIIDPAADIVSRTKDATGKVVDTVIMTAQKLGEVISGRKS